jgi:hypothetical protein
MAVKIARKFYIARSTVYDIDNREKKGIIPLRPYLDLAS